MNLNYVLSTWQLPDIHPAAFFLLVLVFAYFQLGLSFFPATRRIALTVYDYVWSALATIGNAIVDQMPGLIFIAILLVGYFYAWKRKVLSWV